MSAGSISWGQGEGPRELVVGRKRGPGAKRQVGEVVWPREGRIAGRGSESEVYWSAGGAQRRCRPWRARTCKLRGLPHQVGRWKRPDRRGTVCLEVCAL